MFVDLLKYNRYGKKRFASKILIDSDNETVLEILDLQQYNRFFFYFTLLFAFSSIISFDLINFVLTVPFYYSLYFLTSQKVSFMIGNKRMLSSHEYRFIRILKFVPIYLFILAIMAFYQFIFRFPIYFYDPGLILINSFLSRTNLLISSVILHFFYSSKDYIFQTIGFLSFVIHTFVGLRYSFLKYSFIEFHYKNLSEVIVQLEKKHSLFKIVLIFSLFIYLFILLNLPFLLVFFLFIIVIKYSYGSTIGSLQFYGRSGRQLSNKLFFNTTQYRPVTRAIGYIFNWDPVFIDLEEFPKGIIPNEVASIYPTGLRASLKIALFYGNLVGLSLSILLNLFVAIRLINFALEYAPQMLWLAIVINISLAIFTVVFWFFMSYINKIRFNIQKNEYFAIGSNFVSRFFHKSLWVVKSDLLEGKGVKQRFYHNFYRYDRAVGLQLEWARILLVTFISFFAFLLSYWIIIGALNLSLIVLVFPFLLDLGFEFLTVKANAELNFFIFSSFIIWVVVQYFFPQIYAITRPTIIISTQHLSGIPLIMRNQKDFEDASDQLALSLVSSAANKHRRLDKNPGMFLMELEIIDFHLNNSYTIEIGDCFTIIHIDPESELPIKRKFKVSGIYGYPRLNLSINNLLDKSQLNEIIEFEGNTIQLKMSRSILIDEDNFITFNFTLLRMVA